MRCCPFRSFALSCYLLSPMLHGWFRALRYRLRFGLRKRWMMWRLRAPVFGAIVLAQLDLLRGLPLLGVVVGSPGLPLARPSVSALTHPLHLPRSKGHARVFGDRGHVPRSTRWGGGVSSGTLGDLGVMKCRSLGGRGSPLRVSGPYLFAAPSLPCPAPPSELQTHVHPWAGSCLCGSGFAGGGLRACSSFPGLLQPFVYHSQGHRWLESGDRPLTPQQMGGCLPFPRGDYPVCFPVSPSGRLDGFPGSPGCVLLGPNSSIVPALPEVLRGGGGGSVFQFRSLCFGLSTAPQAFHLSWPWSLR